MARSKRSSKQSFAKKLKTNQAKILLIAIPFALIGVYLTFFSSAATRYFNPARETSRQAIASFLYRAAGSPPPGISSLCGEGKSGPFKDVKASHDFCVEIEWMSKQKITTTKSTDNFGPDEAVTRQAAAAFLYRASGSPSVNSDEQCAANEKTGPFKDVKPASTFCKEILWLTQNAYLKGYSDGTFKPDESLSRQAAAVAIHNINKKPAPTKTTAVFADVNKQHQFYNAIQWLGEKEFSKGFETKLPNIIDQPEPTTTKPTITTTTGTKPTTSSTQTAAQTALAADKLAGNWHLCQGTGNNDQTRAVVSNLKGRLHEMGFKFVGNDSGTTYGVNTARAVTLWRTLRWKQVPVKGVQPGCWHSPTMLAQFRYDKEKGWKFTETQNAAEISYINTVAAATAPTTAPAGASVAAPTIVSNAAATVVTSVSNTATAIAGAVAASTPTAPTGRLVLGTCQRGTGDVRQISGISITECFDRRNQFGDNKRELLWNRVRIYDSGNAVRGRCKIYGKEGDHAESGINPMSCLSKYASTSNTTKILWGDSDGLVVTIWQR